MSSDGAGVGTDSRPMDLTDQNPEVCLEVDTTNVGHLSGTSWNDFEWFFWNVLTNKKERNAGRRQ